MYKGIIYKATNKTNGMVYVGQTTKALEERIKEHIYSGMETPLGAAIQRYGKDAFIWEVIEYLTADSEGEMSSYLHIAENYHIMKTHASDPRYGYNVVGAKRGQGQLASRQARGTLGGEPLKVCPGFEVKAGQSRPFAIYDADGEFLKYYSSSAEGRAVFMHKGCHIVNHEEFKAGFVSLLKDEREIVVKLSPGEVPPENIRVVRVE